MYYYDRDLNGNADDDRLWLHVSARHQRDLTALRWRAVRDTLNHDFLLCLTLAETSLLWVRIDSWWDDFCILKAHASSPSPSPLAPIQAADLEEVRRAIEASDLPEARARRIAWTRYFARRLGQTRYRMLWEGRWSLDPTLDYSASRAAVRTRDEAVALYEQAMHAHAFEVSHRDLAYPWPLRIASHPDSARVKRWRKAARQDLLPPILCMRVEPLLADVILDGHDRLHAALLEGKRAEFIRLEYISERVIPSEEQAAMRERVEREFGYTRGLDLSPGTVDALNRHTRDAFDGRYRRPAIWTWPLDASRWEAEVRARTMPLPAHYDGIIATLLQEFPEPEIEELIYRRDSDE